MFKKLKQLISENKIDEIRGELQKIRQCREVGSEEKVCNINKIKREQKNTDTDTDNMSHGRFGYIDTCKGLIHYVIDSGNSKILQLFLSIEEIDLDLEYSYGRNIFITEGGFFNPASTHHDQYSKRLNPVEYACDEGKLDLAIILLERGAKFNPQRFSITTLLRLANRIESNRLEEVKEDIGRAVLKSFNLDLSCGQHEECNQVATEGEKTL